MQRRRFPIGLLCAGLSFGCSTRGESASPGPVPPHSVASALGSPPAAPDLRALGEQIGSASVVGLGENHADAGSIRLRNEVVKYLHESLGFDRVVLEAGLFSCGEADAALASGMAAHEAAALCAFKWQTCSVEVLELFDYLSQTQRSSRPLALSGMDPQLSGSAGRERLIPLLEQALGAPLEARMREAVAHLFELDTLRSEAERKQDRRLLEELAEGVKRRLGAGSFWERVVDGLRYLDEDHWSYQVTQVVSSVMGNARDLQMASNVLWLKKQYPGERLILLAANDHLRRRAAQDLQCDDPTHRHGNELVVPMGHALAEALGPDYFVLGMSAASGAWGMPRKNAEAIGPARPGMIEHAALHAASDRVLLARPALERLGVATSLGLGSSVRSTTAWGAQYDAVLVSKSTAPHRVAPTCPSKP
jgi:erythromycin esterase-like protein